MAHFHSSIDVGNEKLGEIKVQKQKVTKKQTLKSGGGGGGGRLKSKSAVEDEEIAGFRRACLVEKWMKMKGNEKVKRVDQKPVVDNGALFFSSGSSSSDSSFGWNTEAAEGVKVKHSCFRPLSRVKTSGLARSAVKQNDFYPFDDDQTDQMDKNDDSGLVRSKTRALKIYASLKKVSQPISPGGRLTTFINAIFTNGHSKKSKDLSCGDKTQMRSERKSRSTNVSMCSSASSFSRSCLNKNPPRSSDHLNNGARRTVQFLDRDDSHLHDQEKIGNKHSYEKPCLTTFPWAKTEKPSFMKYNDKKIELTDDEDEDEDDIASDTSSDLFELDHLAIFKNEEYCEELPVYETTHMVTNRAIASGLVC